MRIELSETLATAEAIYSQLLDAQDKLPNNIRVILGLPEKEEPAPVEISSLNGSPDPVGAGDTIITMESDDRVPTTDQEVLLTDSILRSPSPSAPSLTAEEQSLELNCELGISQFM